MIIRLIVNFSQSQQNTCCQKLILQDEKHYQTQTGVACTQHSENKAERESQS